MFDLSGRVALVTGGNSGIGLGMARGLVSCGSTVVIWGTNEARNAEAVGALGPLATAQTVDIGDEAQVIAAVDDVVQSHGRLDACFANAARGAPFVPAIETSMHDFRAQIATNLDGTFMTLRAAAHHMIALGDGGSLVATSSLAAVMGQAGGHAYAASKGAIVAMVKALAVELARHGIRVNALLPGWIESGMTRDTLVVEAYRQKVLPRIPGRRWGTGDDFAGIAAYLAAPASGYHSGDTIVIDGGYAIY